MIKGFWLGIKDWCTIIIIIRFKHFERTIWIQRIIIVSGGGSLHYILARRQVGVFIRPPAPRPSGGWGVLGWEGEGDIWSQYFWFTVEDILSSSFLSLNSFFSFHFYLYYLFLSASNLLFIFMWIFLHILLLMIRFTIIKIWFVWT